MMIKAHARRHEHATREQIRILQMHSTEQGFEFDGLADNGKTHHFLMTADTLQELTGEVGSQLQLAKVFEQHRQRIFGVATRVFSAGVRGEPIVMRIGFFTASV